MAVFHHSGKIRVAWTRPSQGCTPSRIHGLYIFFIVHIQWIGRHDGGPLRPLRIANHDGNRATQSQPVADSAEHGNLISLKLHAGATAVAKAAPGKLMRNIGAGNWDPGGHVLQQRNKSLAVGFTCSSPTKHAGIIAR
jgi:hypothetical protein